MARWRLVCHSSDPSNQTRWSCPRSASWPPLCWSAGPSALSTKRKELGDRGRTGSSALPIGGRFGASLMTGAFISLALAGTQIYLSGTHEDQSKEEQFRLSIAMAHDHRGSIRACHFRASRSPARTWTMHNSRARSLRREPRGRFPQRGEPDRCRPLPRGPVSSRHDRGSTGRRRPHGRHPRVRQPCTHPARPSPEIGGRSDPGQHESQRPDLLAGRRSREPAEPPQAPAGENLDVRGWPKEGRSDSGNRLRSYPRGPSPQLHADQPNKTRSRRSRSRTSPRSSG